MRKLGPTGRPLLHDPGERWPEPPHSAAYSTFAGEVVRSLAPETEADPAALLGVLVTGFGSLVGGSPYCLVGDVKHHANLFTALVGTTSRGAKGTAENTGLHLLAHADNSIWDIRQAGVVSGEGIVWAVRDSRGDDEGAADKRLLLTASEMSGLFKVMERSGNTVSETLCDAWDGNRPLQTLGKTKPTKASNHHISYIGQITPQALQETMPALSLVNGYGNRWLYIASRMTNLLPEGGRVNHARRDVITIALHQRLAAARSVTQVVRSEEAVGVWQEAYPLLREDLPGMVGGLLARGAPQCLRLSLILALMDGSHIIEAKHLRAALAIWQYSCRTVRFLYGDQFGSDVADRVYASLRDSEKGLTRTEISNLLQRNVDSARIGHALQELRRLGLAACEMDTGMGGRPAERWSVVEGEGTFIRNFRSFVGGLLSLLGDHDPSLMPGNNPPYEFDERNEINPDGVPQPGIHPGIPPNSAPTKEVPGGDDLDAMVERPSA